MEEIGVVTKTDGITAKVTVQKKNLCEGCAGQGTCKPTDEGMEIEAMNPVHATAGQKVKVSLRTQTYLKGSLIVYGIPLVIFIAAAIVGKNVAEDYFRNTSSDLVAALFGFSALVLSLVGIKIWSRKTETKPDYKPVIEEILD